MADVGAVAAQAEPIQLEVSVSVPVSDGELATRSRFNGFAAKEGPSMLKGDSNFLAPLWLRGTEMVNVLVAGHPDFTGQVIQQRSVELQVEKLMAAGYSKWDSKRCAGAGVSLIAEVCLNVVKALLAGGTVRSMYHEQGPLAKKQLLRDAYKLVRNSPQAKEAVAKGSISHILSYTGNKDLDAAMVRVTDVVLWAFRADSPDLAKISGTIDMDDASHGKATDPAKTIVTQVLAISTIREKAAELLTVSDIVEVSKGLKSLVGLLDDVVKASPAGPPSSSSRVVRARVRKLPAEADQDGRGLNLCGCHLVGLLRAAAQGQSYSENDPTARESAEGTRRWLANVVDEEKDNLLKEMGATAGQAEYSMLRASCEPGKCLELGVITMVANRLGLGLFKHDVDKATSASVGAPDAGRVLHFVWRPHHYDAVAFILPDGKETVLVEAGAHREAVDELMKNVRLLHQLDANKAEEERKRRAAPGQAGSGDPQKQSDAGGGRNSVPPSTPKTRKVVKFRDDLSDSSSPERATKLCRFFQDGKECKYGLRCKFRHDRQPDPSDLDARLKKLEQQSQQDPRSRVEAIKDQVKAKRKKGICRVHAAGGRCRYGDNCKFEHSVGKLDGQNSAVITTPVCREYSEGKRCPRGDSCRFAHPADTTLGPFQQASGRRSRKSSTQPDQPPIPAQTMGKAMGSRSVAVCKEFGEGLRCPRGLNCRYAHPEDVQPSGQEDVSTSVAVCREHADGYRCPRGSNCRFAHPEDAEEKSPRQEPKRRRQTPSPHHSSPPHHWGPQMLRAQPHSVWGLDEPQYALQQYAPFAPQQYAPQHAQQFAPQRSHQFAPPGSGWRGPGAYPQPYL